MDAIRQPAANPSRRYRASELQLLSRDFFNGDPASIARQLLGSLLVSTLGGRRCGGLIVETEAYLAAGDSACHAARGRTRRNAAMFGPPGHAYVYAIHSRWCFNVVTQPEGVPSAVLVRAVEPLWGIRSMRLRRNTDRLVDLARGPARLCEALGIDRQANHWDLTAGRRLWIAQAANPPAQRNVVVTPRIGISSAGDLPLRFAVADCRWVSGPRRRAQPAADGKNPDN